MAHAGVTAAALVLLLFLRVVDVDAAEFSALSQGQSLGAADTLVSPNGAFALAFFSPLGGDPNRRYLGVKYARAAEPTFPWVANRDAPVSAASPYSATVTASGELQVLQADRVAWRTNTSSSSSSSGNNVTLVVTDTGNLVLSSGEERLWEGFHHPTDTFLPGMHIALDRRDNSSITRTLFTSWRSPGDPATGDFTLGLDPQGSAQLYIWHNATNATSNSSGIYWRSGQWANTNFVGVPWRSLYVYGFKLNGDPSQSVMSYTFNTYNTSLYRFKLHPNGTEACYMLLDSTGEWETVWAQPTVPCHKYNTCGANAQCATGDDHGQATCACLKGFEPKSAAEYGDGNWTQGCVRSAPLTCEEKDVKGGDGFADLPGVKLPDFAAWGSTVGDEGACRDLCLGNCSCGAYSYSSGTGCLTWGQDLLDIYEFGDGEGYDLHVKVPASVLETGSKAKRWTTVIVIVVIVVVVVLAAFSVLLCKCRRRIKEKIGIGGRQHKRTPSLLCPAREARQDFSGPTTTQPDPPEDVENGGKKCELPLFSFETLAAATGDFSGANKLGEGGFGHVYKGTLPTGEEIAVKRLSRSSGQGLEEFKNEVILIAKLQHRNLVKLLGCCIQGEEKILVYEYMPNKSLDAFLFDPARRSLLDWNTRLHVIEGIARGLLYLHRDSRLRVVHRDLKASNILLDRDMNPKISDFGMARIFGGDDQNQVVNTNRVVGTLGYMSPEYAMEGLFSVRSDMYSFGILVLEIISGQKNSSFHHMEGSLNIVGYAWQLWNAGRGEELIDPAIQAACPAREALRCLHLALLCVQDHACDRPDIPYVVMALGSDSAVLPMPRPPTFTLQCTSSEREALFRDKAHESYSACDLTVTVLHGR
ncbi:hypothetical protein PR202_ga29621 [Eleusine coracana subsp. coracana]|uniref:Receptor-like serine/threonine-protein kinase n=1 Tax=Eleusine coracana subsp. coracana TaxID=191504 RepID=A0AAV5DMT7_ELECO|nr:hypothetical protein QOZ80_7AG0571580 [Eleusine coracana subsp. coracana]GJN11427.1 hypothetical protein PR202_ga29621 [Eleusine coracana subsp. coracana]